MWPYPAAFRDNWVNGLIDLGVLQKTIKTSKSSHLYEVDHSKKDPFSHFQLDRFLRADFPTGKIKVIFSAENVSPIN